MESRALGLWKMNAETVEGRTMGLWKVRVYVLCM